MAAIDQVPLVPPLPDSELNCELPPPLPQNSPEIKGLPPLPKSPHESDDLHSGLATEELINFTSSIVSPPADSNFGHNGDSTHLKLSPPLPMQMSSQSNEGLDFAHGDDGHAAIRMDTPPLCLSPENDPPVIFVQNRPDHFEKSYEPPAKRMKADSPAGCQALKTYMDDMSVELCKNSKKFPSSCSSHSFEKESIFNDFNKDTIAIQHGWDIGGCKKSSLLAEKVTEHEESGKKSDSIAAVSPKIENLVEDLINTNAEVVGIDCLGENTSSNVECKNSVIMCSSGLKNNDISSDLEDRGVKDINNTFEIDDEDNDYDDDDDDDDEDDVSDMNNRGDIESEDDDVDAEEIDAMLESAITRPSKKRDGDGDGDENGEEITPLVSKEKVVLIEKGHDPFEILPGGWINVTHASGIQIYLHRETRVVTLTKPYFIGPGSARKHAIPTSAIPCLQYRRALQKEKEDELQNTNCDEVDVFNVSNDITASKETAINKPRPLIKKVKVETAEERDKEMLLDADEVYKYCQNLFQFKTITVQRFKTWKDRRNHQKAKKSEAAVPSLPQNTKLVTCPVLVERGEKKKKEFVLNPSGKSYVCILHEYAQQSMRVQPQYKYKELENVHTPYSATVVMNGVEYGVGLANSKKNAKAEAAKKTLGIVMPELLDKFDEKEVTKGEDLSFFDQISIEDPRMFDFCNKAGQPSPYQILLECLQRNYGFGDNTDIKSDMKQVRHKTKEFTMTVGKHTAKILCKNKREGKQLAAQNILQKLHPHITKMGSLLRLYGRDTQRIMREKMEETNSVIALQHQGRLNRPNFAILNRLQEEMHKMKASKSVSGTEASTAKPKTTMSVTMIDL